MPHNEDTPFGRAAKALREDMEDRVVGAVLEDALLPGVNLASTSSKVNSVLDGFPLESIAEYLRSAGYNVVRRERIKIAHYEHMIHDHLMRLDNEKFEAEMFRQAVNKMADSVVFDLPELVVKREVPSRFPNTTTYRYSMAFILPNDGS